MNAKARAVLLAMLGGLAACWGKSPGRSGYGEPAWSLTVTDNWTQPSRAAARELIEKYGVPSRTSPGELVWDEVGRWQRLAVRDRFPGETGNHIVTGSIRYHIPAGKRRELESFSDALKISPDGRSISATAASEQLDFLALNLAHEIVQGVRNAEQARKFHDRAVELAAAGKTPLHMRGLLFARP
jgi:hypothetical protein